MRWLIVSFLALACADGRDRTASTAYVRPPVGEADAALNVPETAPEALTTPRTITWKQDVVVGRRWWHRATVGNVGRETLRVDAMGIDGDGFAIRVGDVWFADDPMLVDDPDGDGVPGIVEGSFFQPKIYFIPERAGPHEAVFWLRTNDPRSARFEVALQALALDRPPCAPAAPDPLDFADVPLQVERTRQAVITNCNEGPLHILAIEPSEGPFSVAEALLEQLPIRIPAPEDVFDQPSAGLPVQFAPVGLGEIRGALFVQTDDPDSPQRSIELSGVGVPNRCPVARVEPGAVRAALGDRVELDAGGSTDPEGQALTWAWSLPRRPDGSGAVLWRPPGHPLGRPPPNGFSRTAVLVPDVVGRYRAQLDVEDEAGNLTSACGEVARSIVDVELPRDGLVVELTWDMERPSEVGTDLDVHLLMPGGEFFSRATDTWAANPQPPYEAAEGLGPRLAVTTDGGGPEILRFPAPEGGASYVLAVHYFRQHDLESEFDHGASTATVRIYAHGELAWTSPARRMEAVNGFWVVGNIEWPGPRVELVDQYRQRRP